MPLVDVRWAAALGATAVFGTAAAGGAYLKFLRPRQLVWGATPEEIGRAMVGDSVVELPTYNATRAVTIEATPQEIWPWIVQMGIGRAGWYSYDWIDNLGRKSARQILPEYQFPQSGDLIPVSPGGRQGFRIRSLEREKWMLWWDGKGQVTWFWGMYPVDERTTRLVTRVRIRYNWAAPQILFFLLLEAGDIVLMRKCLLGIKERAEDAARKRRGFIELLETTIAAAFHGA